MTIIAFCQIIFPYLKDAYFVFHSRLLLYILMIRFFFLFQGTLSLSPLGYASKVLDYTALAGLMVVLVACLDCRNLILSHSHYLMYCLAITMEPRWLVTVDENLKVYKITYITLASLSRCSERLILCRTCRCR